MSRGWVWLGVASSRLGGPGSILGWGERGGHGRHRHDGQVRTFGLSGDTQFPQHSGLQALDTSHMVSSCVGDSGHIQSTERYVWGCRASWVALHVPRDGQWALL